jgi:hypothetical protein
MAFDAPPDMAVPFNKKLIGGLHDDFPLDLGVQTGRPEKIEGAFYFGPFAIKGKMFIVENRGFHG